MEILTASIGFCIGINRAYRGMSDRALQEPGFTVAHQNSKMEYDTLRRIERGDPDLLKRYPGLRQVAISHDVATLGEGDRLVLGFHGLAKNDKASLATRGVDLLDDLICPFIAKLDRVVEQEVKQGFDVAMVGSPDNHHLRTARKIAAEHDRRCFAIVKAAEVEALPFADGRPFVLVGEVTGNTEVFHEAIALIERKQLPIKVRKTMCSDSYARQRGAAELAERADVVVLIDDGGDGARSVFEVCARRDKPVHRVRSKDLIEPGWFSGANIVAIVGGILVPEWVIAEAAEQVRVMATATKQPARSSNTEGVAS
jgi:4-hydroxy-3-methylbut-2-enyl diphosphate reductase